MYKNIFFFLLAVIPSFATAQLNLKQKKLISAVEIFAGPNASFNYGNKFIENYEDENVTNKRLLKIGYAAGIGIYHSVSTRIDLNVRLQYETKGTKNELNVPSLLDNTSRYIISSKYTYKYYTASFIPSINIGKRKNLTVGIGGYYSKITGVKAYDKTFSTRENIVRSEIQFEGRIFRDLREDGTVEGTSISKGLFEMNKNDYGSILFIQHKINISDNIFNVHLMHQYGFQNININNSYGLEEKNHSLILALGYYLPL